MIIDEAKEDALTKITHGKNTVKKVTSDHNVMLSKFSLTMPKDEPKKRIEVFNFKDRSNEEKFKETTSSTPSLSKVFDTTEDVNIQTQKFLKILDKYIRKSFKKVRLGTKKPKNPKSMILHLMSLNN